MSDMEKTHKEGVHRALAHGVRHSRSIRKRLRCNIVSGATTLSSGSILRVRLPATAGLLDLGSLCIAGDLTLTGANAKLAGGASIFRRVAVQFGAVSVNAGNSQWNHTQKIADMFKGIDQARANAFNGNCPEKYAVNGDRLNIGACWDYTPLQGILYAPAYGTIEVDMLCADDKVVQASVNTDLGTWSLANVSVYVDNIELPAESPFYRNVESAIRSEGGYVKTMELAHALFQNSQGNTNTMAVSTGCLNSLFVGAKSTTYDLSGGRVLADGYLSPYFRFTGLSGANSTASIFFQVGNLNMPVYGHSANFDDLAPVVLGGNLANPYAQNRLFLTQVITDLSGGSSYNHASSSFKAKNALVKIPVGAFPSADGVMYGLDLAGASQEVRVEQNDVPASTPLFMGYTYTGMLTAKDGAVVGFTQ